MARLQQNMQAAGTTGLAATSGLPRAMALRLIRDLVFAAPAKDVAPANAFSFHVPLQPVALDLWIDGTTARQGH